MRTLYRILVEQEVRERRDQLRHPHYQKPELLAFLLADPRRDQDAQPARFVTDQARQLNPYRGLFDRTRSVRRTSRRLMRTPNDEVQVRPFSRSSFSIADTCRCIQTR